MPLTCLGPDAAAAAAVMAAVAAGDAIVATGTAQRLATAAVAAAATSTVAAPGHPLLRPPSLPATSYRRLSGWGAAAAARCGATLPLCIRHGQLPPPPSAALVCRRWQASAAGGRPPHALHQTGRPGAAAARCRPPPRRPAAGPAPVAANVAGCRRYLMRPAAAVPFADDRAAAAGEPSGTAHVYALDVRDPRYATVTSGRHLLTVAHRCTGADAQEPPVGLASPRLCDARSTQARSVTATYVGDATTVDATCSLSTPRSATGGSLVPNTSAVGSATST